MSKTKPATVYHAHLWGLREKDGGKYEFLKNHTLLDTQWTQLIPDQPFYFLIPQNIDLRKEYNSFWKITDIMSVYSVGIVTARDKLTIHWSKNEAWETVKDFVTLPTEKAREKYRLGKDVQDWKVNLAQEDIKQSGPKKENLAPVLYRPFDRRWTYYTGESRGFICRPRPEVMRHMIAGENMGLTIGRAGQVIGEENWDIIFSTKFLTEFNLYRRGGNVLFPLYLYSQMANEVDDLVDRAEAMHNGNEGAIRRPNLAPEFIKDLTNRLGLPFVVTDGKGTETQNNIVDKMSTLQPAGCRRYNNRTAGVPPAVPGTSRPRFGSVTIRDRGRFPHWILEGATYFVTFRLSDSLPQSLLQQYLHERDDIIKTAEQTNRDLTKQEQRRLAELYTKKIENYLDSGTGECHLSKPDIARLISESLTHFHNKRYRLFAWCIMPNHVHALFKPLPGYDLDNIMHSWKSFSSKEANKIMKGQGTFWQREYYDHLIRDEDDFWHYAQYIAENPEKAGLKNWKWVWVDEMCRQDADTTAGETPALQNISKRTESQNNSTTPLRDSVIPEDIFYYIYAVFHSPDYRERYAEFLKTDFPRVPLTNNRELFFVLCQIGERLVALHLMEADIDCETDFPVPGNNIVDTVKYENSTTVSPDGKNELNCSAGVPPAVPGTSRPRFGSVFINKTQYFDSIPEIVWEFHIGGYQVCHKWLKDRKGRTLTDDDIHHYQYIVAAIKETINLMSQIDEVIESHGNWPIK